MDNLVVAVDQLYKSYGSTKAMVDLSFSVEAQRCYALLGP
jgi:ABC-type multidrug transport system ATPase subunit